MVRSQGNQEFQKPLYLMMVFVQALVCCFPCSELKLSQLHMSLLLKKMQIYLINVVTRITVTFRQSVQKPSLKSSDSLSQFKIPGERFDWSIDRIAVGKRVM